MINRYAIILAAGQGTRMKSKLYKVSSCLWQTNGSTCCRSNFTA